MSGYVGTVHRRRWRSPLDIPALCSEPMFDVGKLITGCLIVFAGIVGARLSLARRIFRFPLFALTFLAFSDIVQGYFFGIRWRWPEHIRTDKIVLDIVDDLNIGSFMCSTRSG